MKLPSAIAAAAALALLGACKKEVPPPLYESVPIGRRDITVSAEAAGTVNPILVVDVKSRASGTILRMMAETGDMVRQGDTLVIIDKRDPSTALAQAEADLEVAQAQLGNAVAAKTRADSLFAHQLLSDQDHETALLTAANARAALVRAQANLQAARDAMTDTDVRAPISGTIIAKNVEAGNVIASAVRDVSGGTVLLKMADLSVVQVSTLVDETDIGKIQPGMAATITVDAYPNRPFQGTVLKIEPQSTVNQNVTMFPVLINIPNPDGALRPGMNAEVEIHVAQRQGVIAIPNSALRTQRDVASAAQVLGLDAQGVFATLAAADSQRGRGGAPGQASARTAGDPPSSRSFAGQTPARPADPPARQPNGQGGQGGAQMALPPGVTQEQAMALFQKRRSGEPLTHADSALSQRMRDFRQQQGMGASGGQPGQGFGGSGGGGGSFAPSGPSTVTFTPGGQGNPNRAHFGAGNNFQFGGSFIVFALRGGKPTPVRIRTGVTDMDYSEVVGGLTENDTVLMLPSASLINSQAQMRERFQRMSGNALPGMRQQQQGAQGGPGGQGGARSPAPAAPAPAAPRGN